MKISRIFTSFDLWLSIAITIIVVFLLPAQVNSDFAKDAYFAGFSVLAVIFAVFFASLAIIMASSQDDFISFLEETGDYTSIISTFRYTLVLLFIALIISMILYIYTSYSTSIHSLNQPKWIFALFTFFTTYALFAVFISTGDAINYSKFRSKFLEIKKTKNQKQ